ncbi:BQ5605_C016g08054 [Microbotryum silenes-dioicae]|uniref:BQ5605_C016g08047 protein n=1 Tax=Microbotryum silenes-dioicae TaxID=796604 RepID=A0A2X0LZ45_9BASI|nr:BQ5605_C016g08047 [Microbotryum silenes-dioicae]SGY20449.1 BQ5605_C016g08054 [Microbotryum silenes-dioicae]
MIIDRTSCNFIKVSEHSRRPVTNPTKEILTSIPSPFTLKVHSIALEGLEATDIHVNSLIAADEKAEAELRWKLDLHRGHPSPALVSARKEFGLLSDLLPRQHSVNDRTNIGIARLAGLEADLNMTGTYDYNILLSSVYMTFEIFSSPPTTCARSPDRCGMYPGSRRRHFRHSGPGSGCLGIPSESFRT